MPLQEIMKKHRIQMNKEKKISGEGGEEVTEFDILVEDLIELSDDTDARSEEKLEGKKSLTKKIAKRLYMYEILLWSVLGKHEKEKVTKKMSYQNIVVDQVVIH